jgi:hypothetical protein
MKTNARVVGNKNNDLFVADICVGGDSGDFIVFTPIVAWAVTVNGENPEMSWATPITVDQPNGGRDIVVNRNTLEWWDFGRNSGKGLDSLTSQLAERAAG